MLEKRWMWLPVLLVFVLLAACGGTPATPTPLPEPSPTMTPVPSDTPEPTATAEPTATKTPLPTDTPEPTLTATPKPTATATATAVPELELGEREIIPQGGFSFQPVVDYDWEMDDTQLFLSNEAGTLMISVVGMPAGNSEIQDPDTMFDEFLDTFAEIGDGVFERSEQVPASIDSAEGTAVDLTGELFGSAIAGQAILVQSLDNYWMFIFAISNLYANEDEWLEVGQPVLTALTDSIVFEETAVSNIESETAPVAANCPISQDASYGYTEDNPIRVGGDAFDGPPRERAFFDNLLGPNAEAITYDRGGSKPYGDTILDIFSVSYPGLAQEAILFVDEYSYSEPMAPVGFTCIAGFPLSAP